MSAKHHPPKRDCKCKTLPDPLAGERRCAATALWLLNQNRIYYQAKSDADTRAHDKIIEEIAQLERLFQAGEMEGGEEEYRAELKALDKERSQFAQPKSHIEWNHRQSDRAAVSRFERHWVGKGLEGWREVLG